MALTCELTWTADEVAVTWREISAEKLNSLRDPLIVDVRSPCEHEAEYIPGSVNIPLLDNEQRAHVGTVYKLEGEIIARRLAIRLISPKIPHIVDKILELKQPGQALVVHCWRGGLRSEAVASFLSLVGLDCWRLTGGYKSFRRMIVDELGSGSFQFETISLQGQTGVGKTEILSALARAGLCTIDLEQLANHRGSVFGGVGLGSQPSQKNFEATLWTELRNLAAPRVFIEAEGRKIGKLSVPPFLLDRMRNGKKILIQGSLEGRVDRIFEEYSAKYGATFSILDHAFAQLALLKERLGNSVVQEIKELVVTGNGRDAIRILLRDYYDPMYDKQINQFGPYDLVVQEDHAERAAEQIAQWYHSTIENNASKFVTRT